MKCPKCGSKNTACHDKGRHWHECLDCGYDGTKGSSRPATSEQLTSGERARRANVAAAVYPIDPIDAIYIHEFLAGTTNTLAVPGGPGAFDRIESIVGWVA